MVARGEHLAAPDGGRPHQEIVPHLARDLFKRIRRLAGFVSDIPALFMTGNTVSGGHISNKISILRAFALAGAVVEMRHLKRDAQFVKHVDQAHGIGSAGYRQKAQRAAVKHMVTLEGIANALE